MSDRATLVDPGHCRACGEPCCAAIHVDEAGKHTAHVYCAEHRRPRAESVLVAVQLDGHGQVTIWAARGRSMDLKVAGQVQYAITQLRLVHRARLMRIEMAAAGPWRLCVIDGVLHAPRPPGRLRGKPWPMTAARLGVSRFERPCVACGERAVASHAEAGATADAIFADLLRGSS